MTPRKDADLLRQCGMFSHIQGAAHGLVNGRIDGSDRTRRTIGVPPSTRVILLERVDARFMTDIKDKIKRGLEDLEHAAKRAGEAAVDAATAVGEDAKSTWNEQVKPGLEPLERETKAHAKKIGDEIIGAVSAALSSFGGSKSNERDQ